MSGNSKSSTENIINACENKPNEEKWMEAKRCFQNLQEELEGLMKKYPIEANKRKVTVTPRQPPPGALMTKNVTTVLEYLEKVQKYHPKSAGEKEAAKMEVLDMADFIYQLKQNDKSFQEQGKRDKVSRIQVRPEVASSPETGGQQKDIDETVSNSKKAKQVYDSDLSKTCVQKPTSQQKGNNLSQTEPSSPNPATVQSNIEKQKQGTASTQRMRDLESKVKQLETRDSSSILNVKEHSTRIRDLESKVKQMETTSFLIEKLHSAEQRCKILEDEKENFKQSIEKLQSRSKFLDEEITKLQSRNIDYENQLQELHQKYMVKEAQCDNLRLRLSNAESRNADVESDNKYLKEQVDELTMSSNSLNEENRKLSSCCQELQSRIKDYESQLQQLDHNYMVKDAQCGDLRLRLKNSELKNADVESENKYLKEQVDELTMRLSSNASKQLSEGNSNILDLSDQNRPTKIGEKFGSLYDDEWSEAFDAITTTEKSEDDAIKYLINIIQESYTFCTHAAHEQLEKLTEKMKTLMAKFEYKDKEGRTHEIHSSLDDKPNIGSARAKYAKDYRKAAACESLLGVKQMFKERVLKEKLDKLSGETKDLVIAYVDKCTELIWFMVVQDPPMVIEIPEPGKKFNANAFKPYKTKGKLVKLAVWPAVKLFENGELISKGYALPE